MATAAAESLKSLTEVDSDSWIELKGPDLLFKVISTKKPLNEGDEPQQVHIGDTVLIDLIGRQSDNPQHLDGPVFQQASSWLVGIGELDVLVRSLEIGIAAMKAGQTAYIWSSSRHNFGPYSAEGGGFRKYKAKIGQEDQQEVQISATASVVYQVTVTQIVVDTSRLNPYFPIQKALTRKMIANDVYQYDWDLGGKARERSIRLYEKAAKDMNTLLEGTYFANVEPDHPQRAQCKQLMLDCLNNVVAVYLRAKRYSKAREAALEVLKHDKRNLKALIRNAKAAILDSDLSLDEIDRELLKAENEVVYKNKAEDAEHGYSPARAAVHRPK